MYLTSSPRRSPTDLGVALCFCLACEFRAGCGLFLGGDLLFFSAAAIAPPGRRDSPAPLSVSCDAAGAHRRRSAAHRRAGTSACTGRPRTAGDHLRVGPPILRPRTFRCRRFRPSRWRGRVSRATASALAGRAVGSRQGSRAMTPATPLWPAMALTRPTPGVPNPPVHGSGHDSAQCARVGEGPRPPTSRRLGRFDGH
jgi:hypothetical protein